MFYYDKGIRINGSSLWIDSVRPVTSCVVSHAHMDHARRHQLAFATPATLALMKKRVGKSRTPVPLEYKDTKEFEELKITLFPAGHILGSAQVLVEKNGQRLLYSGDFAMEKAGTATQIEIPESDVLIMECSFGRPRYRFPPREVVAQQLVEFAGGTLAAGATPVVAGYALGKTQEAMKILGDAGFDLSVHGEVAALARVYEHFGVRFGAWHKYHKDEVADKVLIIPRKALKSRMIKRLPAKRSVFLSGWAINPRLRLHYGVDAALPLSDHADFDGLIQYARKVNPRKIYTTHGFDDFPGYLRRIGFDAELLTTATQPSLS